MNSKRWKEKFAKPGASQDTWDVLKDLEMLELDNKYLEERLEKIINIVMSGNSWVEEVAKIQNKIKRIK